MEFERLEVFQPRYGTVNLYRIGETLVDTGHVCAESREAVERTVAAADPPIDRVVLTHPHIDHVGGSLLVDEVTRLPHVVYEGADEILREYDDYLDAARGEMAAFASGLMEGDPEPDDQYFPTDHDYATDELAIDRVVSAGDSVQVGRYECEVVHTPGHSHQHMSLHHESSGVMISGDIVSTNGHFMYGPLHWDLGEYKTGLRRIRDREPTRLLPGHGEVMDDPAQRVSDALAKAERTEEAVLRTVEEQGPIGAHDIAFEALGATAATVPFLANVASAYVIYLADQGEIEVERRPYVVARP